MKAIRTEFHIVKVWMGAIPPVHSGIMLVYNSNIIYSPETFEIQIKVKTCNLLSL